MASKFAEDELEKIILEVEKKDWPPNQETIKKFANQGFLGLNLKTEYGGSGLGHLVAVLVSEEIAKKSIGVAFPVFESCFGPTWPYHILDLKKCGIEFFHSFAKEKQLSLWQCQSLTLGVH